MNQSSLDIENRIRTSMFPWKGQFSPQLIEYLLQIYPSKKILDPFCGSGTVLYEAALKGIEAYGIDINPAAISLARFSEFCNLEEGERKAKIIESQREIDLIIGNQCSDEININNILPLPKTYISKIVMLLSFGDKSVTTTKSIIKNFKNVTNKLQVLPFTKEKISAFVGDCRRTGFENEYFDLIITSPPYINVFNYHQNYRSISEVFGDKPLLSAKSEIGSNRKNRQNRFLTVVQYCLDMELFIWEMGRVLNSSGNMIMVVGDSSKIRGIPFYNAQLIKKIAIASGVWVVVSEHKRVFVNRFGKDIVESVLNFRKIHSSSSVNLLEFCAFDVAADALKQAMNDCEDITILEDVKSAYARAKSRSVEPSYDAG